MELWSVKHHECKNDMIKLKELLNVTEQAPQPPQSAPVPAQAAPTSAPTPQEPTPAAAPDTAPSPEDPSEYDFTRDFRAFEDTKNKAEAAAKKKLLDKMNKMMLGKKVVANASRGYGQPKTDYTIDNVKKVSVEFWYKDWVVIVSDENDKKFFLTPGINIKIETGGAAVEPGAVEPAGQEAPNEPPKAPAPAPPVPEPEAPTEEPAAPEAPAPEPPAPEAPAPEPAAEPEPRAPQGQPAAPAQPAKPEPTPPPLKKKKKVVPPPAPVAEEADDADKGAAIEAGETLLEKEDAQRDLARLFANFTNRRQFDVRPFVTRARTSGRDQDGMYNTQYRLRIPVDVLGKDFDIKEFQLFVRDEEYNSGGAGQPFSRGSVSVQPAGRTYIFTFDLSGGLDI
jgi:hypothetical protein